VHERLDNILKFEEILFRDYYYCYHHPDGIVPEYSFACECRKPKPYFLLKAARDYRVNLAVSWMVGDRDTDIACGKSAGTQTILVLEPHSAGYHGSGDPDYKAENIRDVVRIILRTIDEKI
jgi:D-glycero-D-manno-heptose 1,7-bisphosphate phosphatase